MRSFREEYRREMDRVGTFHLDIERMSDEIHHHKLRKARRRRVIMSAASAAAVFLMVGGVVTAMNYGSSFIQVRDNGFSITGGKWRYTESETGTEGVGDAGQPLALAKEGAGQVPEEAETECIVYEMEIKEYDSLDAFREESAVVVPIPDMQLVGGDLAEQNIHVVGNQLYISLQDTQERFFSIMKMDHRESQAYASASAYAGEAANERNFTTSQGYTYKVIDIIDGSDVSNIECAISLFGWDLLVGFRGYTQEEAYAVLQSMDLGVYVAGE